VIFLICSIITVLPVLLLIAIYIASIFYAILCMFFISLSFCITFWRYSLAPSSLFFLMASWAFWNYLVFSFSALRASISNRFAAILISSKTSSIVGSGFFSTFSLLPPIELVFIWICCFVFQCIPDEMIWMLDVKILLFSIIFKIMKMFSI